MAFDEATLSEIQRIEKEWVWIRVLAVVGGVAILGVALIYLQAPQSSDSYEGIRMARGFMIGLGVGVIGYCVKTWSGTRELKILLEEVEAQRQIHRQ